MAYGSVNADLMTTSDGVSSSGLYGFKNRIINGAMVIDQRNAGASTNNAGGTTTYALDRWSYYGTSSSKFSIQQSTTAPAGFSNSILITSLAATTIGTNDEYWLNQKVEGFNSADLSWGTADAKTVTLSFWVRSSLTGTFGGSFINSAFNYYYAFSYTISSANTWTQVSITVAGPTAGTWIGSTNGVGLSVVFGLSAGSTYGGATPNVWTSASYKVLPTSAVNILATNAATWYVTGVQLEKGSTATSFDYRPVSTEIQLCQRYFVRWKNSSSSDGLAWNPQISPVQSGTTGNLAITASLPVVMRTTATSVTTNLTNANYITSWTLDSAFVTGNVTKTGTVGFNLTGSASTVTLALTGATWSPNPNLFYLQISSSYVDISAEL